MIKGSFETVIVLAFAVIMLVAMVSLFWTAIRGTGQSTDNTGGQQLAPSPSSKPCSTDSDCLDNVNGTSCIQIGSFKTQQNSFCGCIYSTDCISGVCNENNICE